MNYKQFLAMGLTLIAQATFASQQTIQCEFESTAKTLALFTKYATCPKQVGVVVKNDYQFDLKDSGKQGAAQVKVWSCALNLSKVFPAKMTATPEALIFEYCNDACQATGQLTRDSISQLTMTFSGAYALPAKCGLAGNAPVLAQTTPKSNASLPAKSVQKPQSETMPPAPEVKSQPKPAHIPVAQHKPDVPAVEQEFELPDTIAGINPRAFVPAAGVSVLFDMHIDLMLREYAFTNAPYYEAEVERGDAYFIDIYQQLDKHAKIYFEYAKTLDNHTKRLFINRWIRYILTFHRNEIDMGDWSPQDKIQYEQDLGKFHSSIDTLSKYPVNARTFKKPSGKSWKELSSMIDGMQAGLERYYRESIQQASEDNSPATVEAVQLESQANQEYIDAVRKTGNVKLVYYMLKQYYLTDIVLYSIHETGGYEDSTPPEMIQMQVKRQSMAEQLKQLERYAPKR